MTGWVQVTKSGSISDGPSLKISRSGTITMDRAAHAAIGQPESVVLFVNKDTDQIAIAAAASEEPNQFRVRQRSASRWVIGARRLVSGLGLRPQTPRLLPARNEGDRLVADLAPARAAPQAPETKARTV